MDEKTTAEKKRLFIEGFGRTGVIKTGCEHADISRQTHRNWVERDPQFLADCQDAYQISIDAAEEELRTRSVDGVDEVVIHKGAVVWKRNMETGEIEVDEDGVPIPFTVKKKSDRLLEVYIKAHKPGYREPKGGVSVNFDPVPQSITEYKNDDDDDDGTIKITYLLPDGKSIDDYQSGAQEKMKDITPEAKDPNIGSEEFDRELEELLS